MASQLTEQQRVFIKTYLGIDTQQLKLSGSMPDIVRKRGFVVTRWQKTLAELETEIGALQASVARALPDEDAQGFAAAIGAALVKLVDDFQGRINDGIDAAVSSGDPEYKDVGRIIANVRGDVTVNSLVKALQSSVLCNGKSFASAFLLALDEIEGELLD